MRGLPGHTGPHVRLPNSVLGIDDLTIERTFDLQATWVIYVLGILFLLAMHGCLYNQALADV